MSPKIVDKEKRNREILTAALQLFIEKGYHKTTLGDIARAAGMGQGTLYYYFPAKDLLFWGVYDQLMSDIEQFMVEHINMFQTPGEQLNVVLKLLLENFPEAGIFGEADSNTSDVEAAAWKGILTGFSRVLMEFWLQAERSDKRDEFYQRLARNQQAMLTRLKDLIEKVNVAGLLGLNAIALAHMLMALHDGLAFQLRMGLLAQESQPLCDIRQALFQEFQQHPADAEQ